MKKTLVALAALASIGSAFAQATITPYVRIDVGVQSLTKTGTPDTGMLAGDGIYNGDWGLKGETDLGGGMKGFAQIENAFAANGADGLAGSGNARLGKLGISGGFGILELGAVWGPYDNTTGYGDAQDYNGFSSYGRVLNLGAHCDCGAGVNSAASGNTPGSIQYTTPTIGGLNGTINYAPAKNAANQDISSWGVDVVYGAGPLSLAVAMDSTPTIYSGVGAPAGSTGKTDAWKIEGGYNLGAFSLYGTFIGATANGAGAAGTGTDKDTGWNLSVKMPVDKWTLSAGVGSVKTSGDDMNQHSDAYGMQGLYAINKSLTAYVGYKAYTTKYDSGAADLKYTKTGAGLTMSF